MIRISKYDVELKITIDGDNNNTTDRELKFVK